MKSSGFKLSTLEIHVDIILSLVPQNYHPIAASASGQFGSAPSVCMT
jgi:hypothetical protein